LRFVSGFLLPRYEETGQEDETSDIHLSTHGVDFQIKTEAAGEVAVAIDFSVYVRALPDWDELNRPELDIFPNPTLKREIEQMIRATTKERLAEAKAQEAAKPADQRRAHREIQQGIYRDLLAEQGVRIGTDAVVADVEEDADGKTPPDQEDEVDVSNPRLVAQQGRYIFDNDQAAQELDVPQKWRRIAVKLEPFRLDLKNTENTPDAASQFSKDMRAAVQHAVAAWVEGEEGRQWAYRPATIRPSHYRDANSWNAFLAELRTRSPLAKDIAPSLDGLTLTLQIETDLRDPQRRNVRVMVENNSRDVRMRLRERFEHAIHQVKMAVELPATAHRALKLDRVEPSYRFRDFLSYPAIGINCGVTDLHLESRLRLTTTWMPRYHQPRIVPTEIKNVPTTFQALASEGFEPARLRPLIDAYEEWINTQKNTVDPAHGAESEEEAQRENSKFEQDIQSYEREKDRIALGIKLLEMSFECFKADTKSPESLPYQAWRYLNATFYEAGLERGITGWRLFQLTFVLAHIPTIASRMPIFARQPWFNAEFDEETATLLYFPTGGGKSEAFFGLLIFTLFLDRLRGKHIGISALIRYPLRLLTLQQAQRLMAIIVRAELIRRKAGLGGRTFEIGFWVGSGNTPNKPDDPRLAPVPRRKAASNDNDETATRAYMEVNESFNKIPVCPLCKSYTGLRRVVSGTAEEIGIVCFNPECRWNRETKNDCLPFLIVDRDIYRHAPAVLLGVLGKFDIKGQHPSTINRVMGMFGLARWQENDTGHLVMPSRAMLKEGPAANGCSAVAPAYQDGREIFTDPFPALIIQDEAHLLEESLGTFAGLFETILEQLFVRAADLLGARVARYPEGAHPPRLPKVIAATATVSVPQQQFGALYQRRHMHFPYPGTSIYRSFYSSPAVPANPARRNLAGDTPLAPEIEAPWMRVYTSIMTNGRNHTVTTVAVLAAYHLAITELWQDLLDPTQSAAALKRVLDALTVGSVLTPFHAGALTACAKGNSEILPTLVDLMRISLTYVTNKKGGDQVIDAFREDVAKIHRRYGRKLAQLHTRLISGGVDVKQIQEIMRDAESGARAGDAFPDLEQCLRNIVATSAISHGVDVDKFNAMFFAGMPNDIAEFIQASSRVGRTHVGFSLLIPTPQARRDRYIVETHDIFHRFLERMIAPPAITRWAPSAHDRVLTSIFQAWLCGWAEQKLFIEQQDKGRAPSLETVGDVGQLLRGNALPGAAKDFMDFTVLALGIPGRGSDGLGSAPHPTYYEERTRNSAKQLTDELQTLYTTTWLADYWSDGAVGEPPMKSLRDIDEAGRFFLSRRFGERRLKADEERALLNGALRIVRRQSGSVSELDSEEGEA